MVRLHALLPSIAMALAAPAKHTMKKLVAFDLDGTLLNPEHRLTRPTLDKLRELDGLGVSIVFATGRSAPPSLPLDTGAHLVPGVPPWHRQRTARTAEVGTSRSPLLRCMHGHPSSYPAL